MVFVHLLGESKGKRRSKWVSELGGIDKQAAGQPGGGEVKSAAVGTA